MRPDGEEHSRRAELRIGSAWWVAPPRPLADPAEVGCSSAPRLLRGSRVQRGHQTLPSDVHVIVGSPLWLGTALSCSPRGTVVTGNFPDRLKEGTKQAMSSLQLLFELSIRVQGAFLPPRAVRCCDTIIWPVRRSLNHAVTVGLYCLPQGGWLATPLTTSRHTEEAKEVSTGRSAPLPISSRLGGWRATCIHFSNRRHLPPVSPKFKGRQLASRNRVASLQLGVLSVWTSWPEGEEVWPSGPALTQPSFD